MHISDWSSDVCSSDLVADEGLAELHLVDARQVGAADHGGAQAECQNLTEVEPRVCRLGGLLPAIGLGCSCMAALEIRQVFRRGLHEVQGNAGGHVRR